MNMLEGKVAIITGAGRGIGQAAAELLSEHGAHVVICELDAGPAEETAAIVRQNGTRALVMTGNICDPDLPKAIMASTAREFGRLDILVNNAGYTADAVLHKTTDEAFQAMLDIHLVTPFRMIREATPLMRDAARQELAAGHRLQRKIVNVSSIAGMMGNVGQANYASAKAGVIGLSKTVAKEWGPFGINCNVVAFGVIETRLTQPKEQADTVQGRQVGIPEQQLEMFKRMVPLQRAGTPREAASAILYLVSPLSDYVNGDVLKVDGGFYS